MTEYNKSTIKKILGINSISVSDKFKVIYVHRTLNTIEEEMLKEFCEENEYTYIYEL